MKISVLNILLSIVATCLFATQAFAIISGSDNSSNYITWTNGANGGTGFLPWTLYSNNHGSGFAGLEYNNTVGDANIQVSGSVWKLYAVDFVSTLQQGSALTFWICAPLGNIRKRTIFTASPKPLPTLKKSLNCIGLNMCSVPRCGKVSKFAFTATILNALLSIVQPSNNRDTTAPLPAKIYQSGSFAFDALVRAK